MRPASSAIDASSCCGLSGGPRELREGMTSAADLPSGADVPSGADLPSATDPPSVAGPPPADAPGEPHVAPALCRPARLAADLRVAIALAGRRLRAERASEDVSDGQYSVLMLLDREGPLTPRDLALAEHVQPPSMTRTVNALAEAGLVDREAHPDDGRQVLVRLTAAGAAEVRETRRRRDAWLARQLAALEPRERAVLAEAAQVLRRVAGT
jgi:DNA-binding MarR family transcriptional regulator